MTPRLTPERVREIAARDHGAHCRHCAESVALAADVLALHDALARVTRERDAAVAARDALVTAVREQREAADAVRDAAVWVGTARDPRGERRDVAEGAHAEATDRITALLDGAPADVVRGDVVRAYLAALDAHGSGELADDYSDAVREVDARAALDAALLAAKGAP